MDFYEDKIIITIFSEELKGKVIPPLKITARLNKSTTDFNAG
jgi:hypothetical protein